MRLVLLALLSAATLSGASARSLVAEGNEAYRKERFGDALTLYQEAAEIAPETPQAHFNRGDALYRRNQFEDAAGAFDAAAALARRDGEPELEARARYNQGNAFYRLGTPTLDLNPTAAVEALQRSVRAYREALRLDPQQPDARQNLEIAKWALRQALERKQNQPSSGEGGDDQQLQDELEKQTERQRQLGEQSAEQDRRQQRNPDDAGAQERNQELADQQEQLEQETEQLSRQMNQPEQQQAKQNLENARQKQQQAAEQLENQQPGEAAQSQQEAAEQMQRALDALQGKQREGQQQQASQAQQENAQPQPAQPEQAQPQPGEDSPAQMLQVSPRDLLDLERAYRKMRQQQQISGSKPVEKDW